jgi:hypothetical protein
VAGGVSARIVGRARGPNLEFHEYPLRCEMSILQRGVCPFPHPLQTSNVPAIHSTSPP